MVSSEKMDPPEGHETTSGIKSRHDNNDPSISPNKHLTRLVRFSILQARRSSQASKAAQQNRKGTPPPPPLDNKQTSHSSSTNSLPNPPAAVASNNPQNCQRSKKSPEAAKFPFASFTADKERPTTEVQYEYNDAPGQVGDGIGVVDVPADPPIIEDLSASLTLSAGEHSAYSGSLSEDGGIDNGDDDMDLLLAPDSGSGVGNMLHPNSSSEVYNSAEMYSSSGSYDDQSDHSSEMSSESTDSIMRRVEEEIANARKASNDAQARLAYFTQKQKELSPVLTDSYSFDFENLETSGDMQSMLDVGEGENTLSPSSRGSRSYHGRNGGTTTHDDHYNNAMGVIGKEFDTTASTDVEEKVDIEVVLAPSSQKNLSPPKANAAAHRSPSHANTRRSPRVPSRSPRHRADDSVDIDEAVISAVFSEKSIESLPVKESIQNVFSEQSMESLPTMPTQSSIAHSSIGRPASYSFHEGTISDYAMSPGSQKRPNMLNKGIISPRQRPLEGNLSIETDRNFASKSAVSPLSSSPSKLPSTPREPNTPSYRERLENKLKILGSRYPVSPSTKSGTPNSKKDASRLSAEKRDESVSPSKGSKSGLVPSSPRDAVSSPLGEAYDGLESRIKDLLARTLNPGPSETPQPGDKELAYQSSPSAELKAIKKLLEQGVAAAAAAEERKRELQERQEQVEQELSPSASDVPVQEKPDESRKQEQEQADHLHFPVLDEHDEFAIKEVSEEQSQVTKSKSNETGASACGSDRLPMRSTGPVPPVLEIPDETKDPEPSVTCSTSEEILEALDSFSQSTEFKSKSRKTSVSPRPSTPKHEPEDERTLNSKVKEVLDPSEGKNEANSSLRLPATGGVKLVASLKSYLENAMKPTEADEKESPPSESLVEEAGADKHDALADQGSVQETEPQKETNDNSVAQKESVDVGNVAVYSNEEHCDERSEYESCAEAVREDDRNGTIESKPINVQENQRACSSEISSQATSKKTPSVLNAALSRPAPSDVKDRRKNERRARNRAPDNTHSASDEEEKPESDTGNAVVSSSSHTTDDGSAEHVTLPHVAENEEIPKQSTANPSSQRDDRSNTDIDSVSEAAASPRANVPGIDPRPTEESEVNEGEVPHSTPKEQSMIASLIDPSKNLEAQAQGEHAQTEKAAAADRNDNHQVAQQGRETPPPPTPPTARVKTVNVQSPKSSIVESDERALQNRNENTRQKASTRGDRKIRFRDPYPTPKPCRKPRSTEEIQCDYNCKPTHKERKTRWKEPKGDLKRLLVAALDSSVSRRSNACGALKVISKLEKNKVILVRTTGFLEALVFVATDEITSDEPEAKEDARARAISCIYNVSHVKENRLIICTHHGLLDCLVKTINEDRAEARMEACGILAQLAKSPQCRAMMVHVEDLLSTLASVLKGTIDPEEKMLDILSEDVTEDIPSSYSEMSSVLSEEHIPFPKSPSGKTRSKVRTNCSIRKQKSEMYDQYFELARLSSCAALIHLSKQCSVLDHFCSNMFLLESIVQVARDGKSSLHGKCLEIICNVSRLPGNTAMMTRFPGMVDTLIGAGSSKDAMDRIWALRALQNMTSDASSKAPLATSTLLTLLINCVTSRNTDEQHAAMANLLNLSTDPSAVVPITSTKNVLATLVYLAHNADSTSEIRLMACNALATVGLWLQTVSGFGSIPEDTRRVLLPSHKTTGWDMWD